MTAPLATAPLASIATRPLIFVTGKGGVGKSTIARYLAQACADDGKRRILVALIEDPRDLKEGVHVIAPGVDQINCRAPQAFEEYAALKLHSTRLARLFVQNAVVQYLSQAAPGIRELVLLGKVWFETTRSDRRYDQVIVDLPSTGHALAMFQSVFNFSELFAQGPLAVDARRMRQTLNHPAHTGHLLVAAAEEMPLRETIELAERLAHLFPDNPPAWLCNRRFPAPPSSRGGHPPDLTRARQLLQLTSPLARSRSEYAATRWALEHDNLELWRTLPVRFAELPYLDPLANDFGAQMVRGLIAAAALPQEHTTHG